MNFSHILVPIDFSEHSLKALDAARSLAKLSGGSVLLLHVLQPIVIVQGEIPPLVVPTDSGRVEAAQKELAALIERLSTGVPMEALVRDGHPWDTICEVAREKSSEVIVLASHGYTGLKRMLLGSTAEQVVRHSQCPVLVVKTLMDKH
ncbi:MAG: universal stress protein [Verrucomicrobiales bacterium]|nr:universal stress protein [Verrucomicrobiales bacterium]